jgi:hypothetical protein
LEKNEEYDPNYLEKNQHQEKYKLLNDEKIKNSPNQVEAIPDKQIIIVKRFL